MDSDIIEFRIQELEHEIKRIEKEMDKLEQRRVEVQGAVKEMWKWHETVKDSSGYGQTTFDGKSRVLKLPELGSKENIKDAIENRGTAQGGEDTKLVEDVRLDRAQYESQKLIRLMHGKGLNAGPDQVQERPSGSESGSSGSQS